jgi:hypothetical protein
MPNIPRAANIAVSKFKYESGAFYGSAALCSLGVGMLYEGIRFPLLDEEAKLFDSAEGMVYVLTHECDIDIDNDRIFNEYVLVCPILPFDIWAEEFAEAKSEGALFGIIPDLVEDKIYRAFYLPPFGQELPYGGILYFNQICSTHRDFFTSASARRVCALSSYAQRIIDFKMQNHLFRPKAEQLPQLT